MNGRRILRLGLALLILAIGYAVREYTADPAPNEPATPTTTTSSPDEALARAIAQHRSGVQVTAAGTVDRLLADDDDGSRHQRFLLKLPDGHTLLIAHNIDLAPRVPVERGDAVTVHGQFEWNDRGGVVHWTHHDPRGRHEDGYIEHRGERYR